jgi:hypothetical protein
MKPSKEFQETIKNHLDKRAAEDNLFAETLKKENKSIEECCNYVMKCAQDGGCAGYSDDEVYRWAVHYYDEDDIKNITPVGGKVVINKSIQLTDEEKASARQKAFDVLVEESKSDAKKELSENIELTAEDIADAKKIAMEKVVASERQKILSKTPKKKAEPVTEEVNDLFS